MPQKKTATAKPAKKLARQPGTQMYEKRLEQLRTDIKNLVHHKEEDEKVEPEVGDEADAATQSAERELLFELSDSERQNLDAIEAALRKIGQGSFGICESCTKQIAKPRLKAMPQARYCIQCQARFESPRG
jgi:DnaK suppressor protein